MKKGLGTSYNNIICCPLVVLFPSDCYSGLLQSLDLSSLPDGRSIAYFGGRLYICLMYCFYHLASQGPRWGLAFFTSGETIFPENLSCIPRNELKNGPGCLFIRTFFTEEFL